jgi:hypothetical protein
MYGQLKSLPSDVPEWRLREWEKELQSPTGVTTLHLPPPTMNGIIFSKDCNLVLELDEMVGLELDEFWNKAITYSFILAALTVLQAWSLVKQMEYTSTPVVSHISDLSDRALADIPPVPVHSKSCPSNDSYASDDRRVFLRE